MEIVKVIKVDDVNIKVIADPGVKMEMSEYFTFVVPNASFIPSVRNKLWDGKIRLLNVMTGLIYGGLLKYIAKFCESRGYKLEVENDLINSVAIPEDIAIKIAKEVNAANEPRDYQCNAVHTALRDKRALLLSPTASGKSFIIYLISRFAMMKKNKILIIVPTTALVHQMASDFVEYNNGEELDIHRITGGVPKKTDSQIVISTWQSIYKLKKDWFADFGCVIGDEAHLFKAKALTSIMTKLTDCEYKIGLTGTLDGTDCHRLVLEGLFGPVHQVTYTSTLIEQGHLAEFDIKVVMLKYPDEIRKLNKNKSYQEEIDYIVRNEQRNKYIRNLAWNLKGNTLILFQYVDKHGKVLLPLLQKEGVNVYYVDGSIDAKYREEIRKKVDDPNSTEQNIILASFGTFSTGTNIKKLDNIIFASFSKSKIRNLQSIGRVLRKGNGKTKSSLYDIVDDLIWKSKENYAVKHFKERLKQYTDENFDYKIYTVELKDKK